MKNEEEATNPQKEEENEEETKMVSGCIEKQKKERQYKILGIWACFYRETTNFELEWWKN